MTDPKPPPLLLAGPILRRVTTESMSVWVATSQACTVTVGVFSSFPVSATTTSAQPTYAGQRATVAVGAGLHIAVVTVALESGLANAAYSYNVDLEVTGGPAQSPWATSNPGYPVGSSHDLAELGLLDAGTASDASFNGLGYQPNQYPSFRTPPDSRAGLRLVHGSCFKMHGNGPSMLDALDDVVQDGITDTDPDDFAAHDDKRPHLLLLTGDQIYADDVATALLPVLTRLGQQLLGSQAHERVPVSAHQYAAVTEADLPAGRRQKLIRVTAGMTSDDADNHLIGFFEFAALYLLCWSGKNAYPSTAQSLWPDKLAWGASGVDTHPADDGQPHALDPHPTTASSIDALLTPLFDPAAADQLKMLKHTFAPDRKAALDVGGKGDSVRRALANVPMLTICDDHEVTDDWFITRAWKSRVLASPLGKAMVRNALLAYVLFQAWGNTPQAYATAGTPEAQLLDLIPQIFSGTGDVPNESVLAQVDTLLGLDGAPDPAVGQPVHRLTFNYSMSLANGLLVVLDTRTHREYASADGPPGLLSELALNAQLPIDAVDRAQWLLVVSPAPVLGPRLIEEIFVPHVTRAFDLYHMAWRFRTQTTAATETAQGAAIGYDRRRPDGDLYFDTESWAGRPAAFERFLARVSRCPMVVILAGDVHYAASFVLDYQRYATPPPPATGPDPSPPGQPNSRIVHFTSSAIRNGWKPAVAALANSISVIEHLEGIGFADADEVSGTMSGGRLGWSAVTPDIIATNAPGDGPLVDEARPMSARLHFAPVVLPTDRWLHQHTLGRPPEWGYVIRPIRDVRSDNDRFSADGNPLPKPPRPVIIEDELPADPATIGPAFDINAGPYGQAARVHAADVRSGLLTRTLVFNNNLGIVDFPDDGATAQMTLRFQRGYPEPTNRDEKPHDYVVHRAPLTAITLPEPTVLQPGRTPVTGAPHGP